MDKHIKRLTLLQFTIVLLGTFSFLIVAYLDIPLIKKIGLFLIITLFVVCYAALMRRQKNVLFQKIATKLGASIQKKSYGGIYPSGYRMRFSHNNITLYLEEVPFWGGDRFALLCYVDFSSAENIQLSNWMPSGFYERIQINKKLIVQKKMADFKEIFQIAGHTDTDLMQSLFTTAIQKEFAICNVRNFTVKNNKDKWFFTAFPVPITESEYDKIIKVFCMLADRLKEIKDTSECKFGKGRGILLKSPPDRIKQLLIWGSIILGVIVYAVIIIAHM